MEKSSVAFNSNMFGSLVFNESVMQARLPKATFKGLKKTIKEGLPLEPGVAEVVASVMKDWAVELGATHYTHWFQPLTGITAEKHDSFVSPTSDGRAIMEFSGKELIKGEPDASSFPSGGLRATFEARGYTAWDCTSPAFVKEGTLYIPTAFCSYTGEALDLKTPLLRSMEALSKQAMRVLKLFGDTESTKVTTTMGPEQEYFLIDKKLFMQRKDLVYTGRTLFGAKQPKGQELEDHYFGILKDRVAAFMIDLDESLWKLGVSAKTKHNEVAPAQHELAPIFHTSNIATDHNQLTMEIMKKTAERHGLACLLHEKPFAGVNGSGKHNNWSMSTDSGRNLLEPGKTPIENAEFLVFLAAVVKAVDTYGDLMRVTAASAANDHRLGANEAPPAIISMFLGEELTDVIEVIKTGKASGKDIASHMTIGVNTLPPLPKDTTDRNRTSPFAFTGNKFEFRMVGSSQSIGFPNFVLNAIVCETLSEIAEKLEAASDFTAAVNALVKDIFTKHDRIIFNGNNYAKAWEEEAERRGLPNLKNTVAAIPALLLDKNIEVFTKHGILTEVEVHSRYEIMLESYIKTIRIEALTASKMAARQILPVGFKYAKDMADTYNALKAAGMDVTTVAAKLATLVSLTTAIDAGIAKLDAAVEKLDAMDAHAIDIATFARDEVFTAMGALRVDVDMLETVVDGAAWPMPTYGELLFNV